jgi:hypothetical protein
MQPCTNSLVSALGSGNVCYCIVEGLSCVGLVSRGEEKVSSRKR